MRIAVFCPNLIGDTVMATPTFRAIRRGFPGAGAGGRDQAARRTHPRRHRLVRRVDPFRPSFSDPGRAVLVRAGRLRRGRFDLAVLLPNSVRSAGMAWLAGIPRRVGYANHGRSLLLTEHLHHPRDEEAAACRSRSWKLT